MAACATYGSMLKFFAVNHKEVRKEISLLVYVHTFALQTSNYGINKMKGKNNKYNIR
jgi:hypothetical protein